MTDEEARRALEESPWERMRREAERRTESGVRVRPCAYCERGPASRGAYCGEFCEVADELRER